MVTGGRRTRSRAVCASRASGLPAYPAAVIAGQGRGLPAADDTVTDQALGLYCVADYAVGPYREALSGGEKRLRLAVGQCDGHHGMPAGSPRQCLIPRDDRGEVLGVIGGLEEAAGVCRQGARPAREATCRGFARCRGEGDQSPEPVPPHRGRPSRRAGTGIAGIGLPVRPERAPGVAAHPGIAARPVIPARGRERSSRSPRPQPPPAGAARG